jgi:hypothetical protein
MQPITDVLKRRIDELWMKLRDGSKKKKETPEVPTTQPGGTLL